MPSYKTSSFYVLKIVFLGYANIKRTFNFLILQTLWKCFKCSLNTPKQEITFKKNISKVTL